MNKTLLAVTLMGGLLMSHGVEAQNKTKKKKGTAVQAPITTPEQRAQDRKGDMTVGQAMNDLPPVEVDRFGDAAILSYRIHGFEQLSLQQKKLVYYLYQAALSGRDIVYDQKNEHNLRVRKSIEAIMSTYTGSKSDPQWDKFTTYAKRFWFSNGIHHHYSNAKLQPGFDRGYLKTLILGSDPKSLPLAGWKPEQLADTLGVILFSADREMKNVNLDKDADQIRQSANNFYGNDLTEAEVEAYYATKVNQNDPKPVMYGLNSKLVKDPATGVISEKAWFANGMYAPAIREIIKWLTKASAVAENEKQRLALDKLIRFYQTGDLKDFDEYCIAWVADTESMVDVVNGFIEVYGDAMGKRGSFEAVVSIRDIEASRIIQAISKEAQWFEDNSPLMKEHKKASVKGISAKVIQVVVEAGDAAPSTPIGINLPNSNWIREEYGSKSVSLGNIVEAYNLAKAKSPTMGEFVKDPAVLDRLRKHGSLAADLHTDMHEVIGHASGKINPGIGTPDQTLKNYANTLEEARADLVALYYIYDKKLVDIGVMPSLEVGKAEYDSYLLNGLMLQLNRLDLGENLEEAHMRNRQLVAKWAYEKGMKDNVVSLTKENGKTYITINDYAKLRVIFGQLLREIQRIKSEGDYAAATALVEGYGVKVDPAIHKEVKERYAKLNSAPYSGFIQPRLQPVMKGNDIVDISVSYPRDFVQQMMTYGREYGFLPVEN